MGRVCVLVFALALEPKLCAWVCVHRRVTTIIMRALTDNELLVGPMEPRARQAVTLRMFTRHIARLDVGLM
jgi:hypothetical protein